MEMILGLKKVFLRLLLPYHPVFLLPDLSSSFSQFHTTFKTMRYSRVMRQYISKGVIKGAAVG
jgi:hypothetical protein